MSNEFLKKYFLISDIRTVIFLFVLFAIIFLYIKLKNKNISFTIWTLSFIGAGLLIGFVIQIISGFPSNPLDVTWISEVREYYNFIGSSFMAFLRILVIPMIFFSLVSVLMKMKGKKSSKTIVQAIFILTLTTIVASIVGIILGLLFNLGSNTVVEPLPDAGIRDTGTIISTIWGFIPKGIDDLLKFNIIGVIIMSFIFGGILGKMEESKDVDAVKNIINGIHKIIAKIILHVLDFLPIALFALLTNSIISNGVSFIFTSIKFIIALYIGCAIMILIHLVMIKLKGVSIREYFKSMSRPLLLAFTSRSSLGTLPSTIKSLENNLNTSRDVANIVPSLGANMGMNGCAGIYPSLAIIMVANMVGIPMDFGFFLTLIVVVAFGSLGMAGIPGAATISIALTFSAMGISQHFALLGAILAIDPILDMMRTMTNVNGAVATAIVIDRKLKKKEGEQT